MIKIGLDMYLRRKKFIYGDEKKNLKILGINGINPKKVSEITEDAMYWRKANAIHKWFVDNVQNGKDDCGNYDVSKEQLKELLNIIETVLKYRGHNKVKGLLPLQEGFFFGGKEYDEWYYEELERTAKELRKILKRDDTGWDYEYHSSW